MGETGLVPASCPWQIYIATGLRSAASLITTGVLLIAVLLLIVFSLLGSSVLGWLPLIPTAWLYVTNKAILEGAGVLKRATALLSPPSWAAESPATSPLLCHSSHPTVSLIQVSVPQTLFCALWGYGSPGSAPQGGSQ